MDAGSSKFVRMTVMSATTTLLEPTTRTLPEPERLPYGYTDGRRSLLANVPPKGTRTGWAMRSVYLASDLAAFSLSLALAVGLLQLVNFSARVAHSFDLRIYALWFIGLIGAAAAQQTYAAIPPRPVRKFRGWVLGAIAVWFAVDGAAWMLGAGSLARDCTLAIATVFAILLASFCRAVCRIFFGAAPWWGTRLVVVGSGPLA